MDTHFDRHFHRVTPAAIRDIPFETECIINNDFADIAVSVICIIAAVIVIFMDALLCL